MRRFSEIESIAAKRHGGPKSLEALLKNTKPSESASIATTPDDRVLSLMTRRVFYSGFSRTVIDQKWEAFEKAFRKFDPVYCASTTGEQFDSLVKNSAIVRNGAKIASVQTNARLILGLAAEHGSAARFFAKWPDADYVGLLAFLKKNAGRLGGETGMRFLRELGKPAFILTKDVVAALIREKIVSKTPTGKDDMGDVQEAMNQWSAESGRSLTDISRILAMSIDGKSLFAVSCG